MKAHITILFLLLSVSLLAQVKHEKEYPIKSSEVPQKATVFVDSLKHVDKIHWVKEISHFGVSFEAKIIQYKSKYSIEFDSLGVLIDVEETIKEKNLDEDIRTEIKKQLEGQFTRYKIEKIQIQWSGDSNLILMAHNGLEVEGYIIKYEVVVEGKKDGEFKLYEFLFDENGKFEQQLQLIEPPTNNMDF